MNKAFAHSIDEWPRIIDFVYLHFIFENWTDRPILGSPYQPFDNNFGNYAGLSLSIYLLHIWILTDVLSIWLFAFSFKIGLFWDRKVKILQVRHVRRGFKKTEHKIWFPEVSLKIQELHFPFLEVLKVWQKKGAWASRADIVGVWEVMALTVCWERAQVTWLANWNARLDGVWIKIKKPLVHYRSNDVNGVLLVISRQDTKVSVDFENSMKLSDISHIFYTVPES